MISVEDAHQYLEQKNQPNLAELRAERLAKLSPAMTELGELILHYCHATSSLRKYEGLSTARQKLTERLTAAEDRLWEGEYFQVLEAIFGEFAGYVCSAWHMQTTLAYQDGYSRRSFRAPHDSGYSLEKKITWLMVLPCSLNYDFKLHEYARYSCYINAYANNYSYLFAAAIDADGEAGAEVLTVLLDSVYGRDDIGGVSRDGLKALLLCNKPEAHEAVEKLLLSAQRQEGLRQTVLECLDETHPAALRRFMRLIIEHKLARFSSVVRAIDVWFGFGWESERQTAVYKVLEHALHFLDNPAEIPAALDNPDNLIVYTALWAQGVEDIAGAFPLLEKLLQNPYPDKQATGLYFLYQTDIAPEMQRLALPLLEPEHLQVAGWVVNNLASISEQDFPEVFSKLEALLKYIPKKGMGYQCMGFSWLDTHINPDTLFTLMLQAIGTTRPERLLPYFSQMNVDNRRRAAKVLFEKPNRTPEIRAAVFQVLGDRSEYVREQAFKAVTKLQSTLEEIRQVEAQLSKKAAHLRQGCIEALLRQDSNGVLSSAERLLSARKTEQRLAGLDLLARLKKRQDDGESIAQLVRKYGEKEKISAKEHILLDELLGEAPQDDPPSLENAFGLLTSAGSTPSPRPHQTLTITLDLDKAESELRKLDALIEQHKTHEYARELEIGASTTILLGNHFPYCHNVRYGDQAAFAKLPLAEVWQSWWEAAGLAVTDLLQLSMAFGGYNFRYLQKDESLPDWLNAIIDRHYVKPQFIKTLRYPTHIKQLCDWLATTHCTESTITFVLNNLESVFAAIPEAELNTQIFTHPYYPKDKTWRGCVSLLRWAQLIVDMYGEEQAERALWTEAQKIRLWHLLNWKSQSAAVKEADSQPPLALYLDAVQLGQANHNDLRDKILRATRDLSRLTAPKRNPLFERYDFLEPVVMECRDRLLEIELKRGDSDTPATACAGHIASVPGIPYLLKILTALGDEKLQRGYFYSYDGKSTKKAILSHFLKVSRPHNDETQAAFATALDTAAIPAQRLLEAAVYAPAWAGMLEKYLGWADLQSAVWWLHAHTKEHDYQVEQKWENHLQHYTPLHAQDLVDGAVDVAWFKRVYAALGKARWDQLYAAAKYTSGAAGHRRAQLFADSMTGQCGVKAILEKIRAKRDKDTVRALGLVPLDAKKPEQDTLHRYQAAVQFRKESKQFGAQRQASEALAVRICLENLARTAGFSDPIRLTWAMESREVADIFAQTAPLTFDDTTITLVVDPLGKAAIEVEKAGKKLKSIPAAHRKKPPVQQLQAHKKTLTAQYARTRQALEEAMNRGDVFALAELRQLARHPVVAPMLNALVWVAENGGGLGFPDPEWQQLETADQAAYPLADGHRLRIAHCVDLHASGAWRAYQHACFDAQRIQPFKQVFRELYLLTADEKAEKSVSRRYAGHQIQPQQAAALLKSRGWRLDYESGAYPEKVFHHERIQVVLSCPFDLFTPADVEAPSLETVEFVHLDSGHNVPFDKIQPRTFSEVMRDLDLVVSVAHAGGVDPEASHSTLEMRTVLIRETAMLLGLDNLDLQANHALIHGKLGDYSVHLGSGTVHRQPGGALFILPVHSAQRGRIFLPFADDDPKSAEIVAKILLLAKDDKIKDPTILQQLN